MTKSDAFQNGIWNGVWRIAGDRDGRPRCNAAEQRGSVEKKPLTFLWRFEREIKQRNRTAVARGKKGEDGASSPRVIVGFEYKRIGISIRRKKRRTKQGKWGTGEWEGERERERKREDRLHIKWTGNEPGYVESVGKSVCRCLSTKFARLFTRHTAFRLHRVHARDCARARKCRCVREGARVHACRYIYVCAPV